MPQLRVSTYGVTITMVQQIFDSLGVFVQHGRAAAIPDMDDDDDSSEIRGIVEQHGFDYDAILNDYDFLSGITSLFSKGDGRRWTTLNFAYQLACYQVGIA